MTNITEYHQLPAIGKSDLDLVHKSPLHYWAERLDPEREPPEPTSAMIWGTAVHTAILESDRYDREYAEGPAELRSKADKEWKAEMEAAGYTVLRPHELASVHRIRDAVWAHPAARYLLSGADVEQTVQWQDRWTQLTCKARPDIVRPDGILADFKTTKDASPGGFQREAFKHRYHVQAAWYARGWAEATGQTPPAFLFIAVETEPPYLVAVYVTDEEQFKLGAEEADEDLQTLASCFERNEWPGYGTEIRVLGLPPYAKRIE